ncbi:hypothetical protein [Lactobacillus phage Semele]|uniref:YopX protein domain-containing protein n=1 Tax=Lactobacillus phage Semele TaxID=2079433 RepID=A0A2K9VD32_9CAUD|nr:hypothetical protein HOS80_gp096 [Lactobacillus phage Semele]AUV60122.1 hypothetical protein [Lactobacillus phage Semele]
MYIDDFVKEVKELSSKYDVEVTNGQVDVYYSRRKHARYHKVLTVPLQAQYTFTRRIGLDDFEALPFSHKLYMLGAELAMTPLDERTPESYKRAQQTKEINRAVQEANHAQREARVAEHKANKSNFVELQPLPDYTGINDATGEPIYVGDIVERVIDMRNSYSALENRDKEKFPDFDKMGEPFKVKRDCYLYGHWIAKSVADGDKFGVDGFHFGKELLKVNGGNK